jgi:fructose-1,6-bisphosphatase/inositol monophosphatase family enzyme
MTFDSTSRAEVVTWVESAAEMSRQALDLALVERKSDGSAVTDIDRGIEEFFHAKILGRFPDHAILGEEFGWKNRRSKDQAVWIIDPLDGTEAFGLRLPTYAISLALYLNQKCVYGCVHLPFPGKSFEYFLGDTWVNQQKLQRKEGAVQVLLAPTSYHRYFNIQGTGFAVRNLGSFCYHATCVLSGVCDALLANKAKVWDLAAVAPMMAKQGLVFSDFNGKILDLNVSHVDPKFEQPFLMCQSRQLNLLLSQIQLQS